MIESQAPRILAHLREHRAEMTALLRDLTRIESPSTVPRTQRAVFDLLVRAAEPIGLRPRHIRGRRSGGHLYLGPARETRCGPYQLLIGHCDTVWPLGTLARMPVTVEGDVLRGPGAFDMKGGVVQALYALRTLRDLGLEPPVAPVAFINSDEELGSPESARHIARLARGADRAYVLEPALGPEGKLKTARKGVGHFVVRVTGQSAHAGLEPEAGASAILELAHLIQRLHSLNDLSRGVTVNVGMVEGGVRPNVVAAESRAEVDVRVPTREDARDVERAIRSFCAETPGTRIDIEGGMQHLPMERTARNRALWAEARRLGTALGLELREGFSGGASDGNTTSRYTATLDGLGAVGDGAHAPHEFVRLDRMVERTALLALLLLLPPIRN
ncbi:MAG: M20 family metallopeptidase [Gemmatimonadota bacterium]